MTTRQAALGQTPSQTIGPFFAYGLTPRQYNYPLPDIAGGTIAADDTPGERIRIEGRVLDGAGRPLTVERMRELYAGARVFADAAWNLERLSGL